MAFLLTMAVRADNRVHSREMRVMRRHFDEATLQEMEVLVSQSEPGACELLLQEALPKFLDGKEEKARLQGMLRDIFLADGEYGPEEQALTEKISAWLA